LHACRSTLEDPLPVEKFASAACAGDVLLVLRRMPLTDPITGFIIVKPVIIESSIVAGDVLYLPPDVPILLYGDGYRARIRNHGHSCFLCEIVIRSQFHTTYEPEA
jgi:hypothetical protein